MFTILSSMEYLQLVLDFWMSTVFPSSVLETSTTDYLHKHLLCFVNFDLLLILVLIWNLLDSSTFN